MPPSRIKGLFSECPPSPSALTLSPGFAIAYLYRGEALQNAGQAGQALSTDDEAIRLAPAWALAWETRGRFYQVRGDQAKARLDFDQARQTSALEDGK